MGRGDAAGSPGALGQLDIGRQPGVLPDNGRLASGGGAFGKPAEVKVWEVATGKKLLTLTGPGGPTVGLKFASDGRQIISGCQDGTIKVWSEASGQEVVTVKGHPGTVHVVAFTGDGQRLVSSRQDGAIKVQSVTTGETVFSIQGQSGRVVGVASSADGSRFAWGGGRPERWLR